MEQPPTRSPDINGEPAGENPQRALIVEAATAVFRSHGLAGARTFEIAKAAGVSESALFRHFRSKEDIFFAAVFEPLEAVVAEVLVDIDRLNDADEKTRTRTFLAEMERQLALAVDLTPLLGVGLFSDPALGRTFYNERLWPLFQRWAGGTEFALRGRPHRDVDPLTMIMTIWGMCYGIALDAMMRGVDVDVHGQARWLGDLLYYGMARSTRRNRVNADASAARAAKRTKRTKRG
ncbi:TetR/AcrR family transcriptional regulator [Mycobacterium sp. EPa45]|uniref:TetR/AcrR family transcriptional regulator n=1 Tax=Mycobacterium sp. EPa45 TaxID=1545728 RepID=UPI0006423AA9|nr:TetR/AcrR family transcriptional regulator [Mycobacterium sp. EPa45]AKK25484.1 hypothetical protein AB431_00755 [Mycobacterium sp. EPa45]